MKEVKFGKLNWILIITFLLGILLFLNTSGATGYVAQYFNQNEKDLSDVKIESNNITLPVSVDDENAATIFVLYFFEATVKEFKKEGSIYKLDLDTKNEDIPQFVVTEKARILRLNNDFLDNNGQPPEPEEADIDDIKKGSFVQVGANYDIRADSWSVGGITIMSD
jgi:hypothetical protein